LQIHITPGIVQRGDGQTGEIACEQMKHGRYSPWGARGPDGPRGGSATTSRHPTVDHSRCTSTPRGRKLPRAPHRYGPFFPQDFTYR
jgi:hypothetical protein